MRLNFEMPVALNTGAALYLSFAVAVAPLPKAHAQANPAAEAPTGPGVDLLQRYPTKLSAGDRAGERARPWEFSGGDIFRVSHFSFEAGRSLRIETGPADAGIGHCADGAVWAALIPRDRGELASSVTNPAEPIAVVWLRFHPKEISRLFPPPTVFADGASNLVWRMRLIANSKLASSWHSGERALIPEPKDMTVDVDTKTGPRRFFVVDTLAGTADYAPFFEKLPARMPPALIPAQAETAFDQLWEAFDQKYAMFVLRPEVDWAKLRDEYRPVALKSKSTEEFAEVCAGMLRPLRDLHVRLTVAGASVPVFNRPRAANFNPRGCKAILDSVAKEHGQARSVAWAVTTNNIGYIAVFGWDNPGIPAKIDETLVKMRDTRGLILDVRSNGGGDEPTAKKVAGRFLPSEFVYASSRYRRGPGRANLTERFERVATPRGPWRYNRPVLLLIGQKCMSSNESFIGMMTGDPLVTTMGDHTCGSSGNPVVVQLPLDMTVSLPQWIDYLPDGRPLDERGFQPKIPFEPGPGAFEGDRDDLLAAALARLGTARLPDKPVEGSAINSGQR